MDVNKIVDEVMDTIIWWYQIGKIEVIDREAVAMALDEVSPADLDWDAGDIISQVLNSMT